MSPKVTRTREETDARIAEIVDLMSSGQWVSGTSHRLIAEREEVSTKSVEAWATSASRLLRLPMTAQEISEKRARNLATLEGIVAAALQAKDYKAATGAIAEQNRLLGLAVTQVQHSGTIGGFDSRDVGARKAICASVMAALESQDGAN